MEQEKEKQSFLKMVRILHKGVQIIPVGWERFLKKYGMTDEEIEQAARYEVRVCRGDFFLPRICNRRNGLDFTKHIGNKGKRNRPRKKRYQSHHTIFCNRKAQGFE
ncbi:MULTISPECIES: hypothetical protein [Brevibacillus]|jgi:hypothetical protein|uniref:hypothetical protein n=1 Tax=Brevibacillus TaxID=55080 RepID=UPI0004F23D17|nr:hypothetical protein [Brevibacillus borstelensis]KKX53607.1 hypothetical protein X546_18280 [Brevibacillus borstelensis cifa_chp40]MCM3592213.1 hypothetical protein [Brevibacillus borstelensis]MCM3622928.1 hypothetical protein [Brevibacillus borstelensis]MED1876267.1 hypothetical protein [Brevibacillus borstelensis]NOU55532.1 hypothetical protein [Brevibacillus borstelensis]